MMPKMFNAVKFKKLLGPAGGPRRVPGMPGHARISAEGPKKVAERIAGRRLESTISITRCYNVTSGLCPELASTGSSRKLAVASSCFSKEGGSPGPECCYLIYQGYTPPPRGVQLHPSLLGTCCCCCLVAAAAAGISSAPGSWLLAGCCCLLLACLLLLDAGCLLLVVCSVLLLLLLFGVVGCCWCSRKPIR